MFGNLEDYKDVSLVGIGSILDERLFKDESFKVIFGSGVRTLNFRINGRENFDVRFVRGPISSMALNQKYIADSAYCLGLIEDKNDTAKKYNHSFIPYFRHYLGFDWQSFSEISGYHVINPLQPVEDVIQEIKASKTIVSSAMHGAILADLYRVPWKRFKIGIHGKESEETSSLKWMDFSKGIELDGYSTISSDRNINTGGLLKNLLNKRHLQELATLIREHKGEYTLSSDKVLNSKLDELQAAVESFKRAYSK